MEKTCLVIYRMIHEKRSIFLRGEDIGYCKKKSSCEYESEDSNSSVSISGFGHDVD
jgi:hypothetical protein